MIQYRKDVSMPDPSKVEEISIPTVDWLNPKEVSSLPEWNLVEIIRIGDNGDGSEIRVHMQSNEGRWRTSVSMIGSRWDALRRAVDRDDLHSAVGDKVWVKLKEHTGLIWIAAVAPYQRQ